MSTMMLDSVVTRLCRIQFYVVLLYTEVKYDNPPGFGGWGNTHRRLIRRRDKGIWEKFLEILIDEPDYE